MVIEWSISRCYGFFRFKIRINKLFKRSDWKKRHFFLLIVKNEFLRQNNDKGDELFPW